MKIKHLSFTGLIVMAFCSSCFSNEASNVVDRASEVSYLELQKLISKIDTIVLEATNKRSLDSAYLEFFRNEKEICSLSGIIPEIFDLVIQFQESMLFYEIWELDWGLSVDFGCRELFLSPDVSDGKFWRAMSDSTSNLSSLIRESYKEMIEKNEWYGYRVIRLGFDSVEYFSELERAYIAIMLITKVVNTY